jgi:hypothetical protein
LCLPPAPDHTPVTGGDDKEAYFAGCSWTVPEAGTCRLRVSSFEAVSTGELVVSRD